MRALTRQVVESLCDAADPEKAPAMAAYMKTAAPFYGVQAAARRELVHRACRAHPVESRAGYEAAVADLWKRRHREEKYAAIDVARFFKPLVTADSLPLYERMIREGAWWDFVDPVAIWLVGGALAKAPERVLPVMDAWIDDDDLWIRRAAVYCQIKRRRETDVERLFGYCLELAHEGEFFLRKAIGTALREHAKTDPDAVRAFVGAHRDVLPGIAIREATRHL